MNFVASGLWRTAKNAGDFVVVKKQSVVTEKDCKLYGARSKKAKQEFKDKFSYNVYLPYWTNFEKMKKHFIDNNESIELY